MLIVMTLFILIYALSNLVARARGGSVLNRTKVTIINGQKWVREGANKRGNSSRLTQSFHFFMFEPIFSPVNALNQPI